MQVNAAARYVYVYTPTTTRYVYVYTPTYTYGGTVVVSNGSSSIGSIIGLIFCCLICLCFICIVIAAKN